jgi:hypothetical protein
MIEIEKYPCKDTNEATERERYWFETLSAGLNTHRPQITQQEIAEWKKEYKIQYRIENADKIKESSIKYRIENADEIKERKKQYRIANADKIKEYKRQYRIANADKIKEYSIKYQQSKRLV